MTLKMVNCEEIDEGKQANEHFPTTAYHPKD